MEERAELERFNAGKKDGVDYFFVSTPERPGRNNYLIIGSEFNGFIYYYMPGPQYTGLVFLVFSNDEYNEVLDKVSSFSIPRYEALKGHLPMFCQAFEDGQLNCPRFDRGAFASCENRVILGKEVTVDFHGRYKKEGFLIMDDSIILKTSGDLLRQCIAIHQELKNFEGFSTWEEFRISSKEVYNNVSVGIKIVKLMDWITSLT